MGNNSLPHDDLDSGYQTVSAIPIKPGTPTVRQIQTFLGKFPGSPVMIFDASRKELDQSEDIPYLQQEVAELEQYLQDEGQKLRPADQRNISAFLAKRKENLEMAMDKNADQTDVMRAIPRSTPPSAAIKPDTGVRGWFKNLGAR